MAKTSKLKKGTLRALSVIIIFSLIIHIYPIPRSWWWIVICRVPFSFHSWTLKLYFSPWNFATPTQSWNLAPPIQSRNPLNFNLVLEPLQLQYSPGTLATPTQSLNPFNSNTVLEPFQLQYRSCYSPFFLTHPVYFCKHDYWNSICFQ